MLVYCDVFNHIILANFALTHSIRAWLRRTSTSSSPRPRPAPDTDCAAQSRRRKCAREGGGCGHAPTCLPYVHFWGGPGGHQQPCRCRLFVHTCGCVVSAATRAARATHRAAVVHPPTHLSARPSRAVGADALAMARHTATLLPTPSPSAFPAASHWHRDASPPVSPHPSPCASAVPKHVAASRRIDMSPTQSK